MSLNHFRIITNIAHQEALQEQPHNIQRENFLERYYNSAVKICSALSNFKHEQPNKILVVSLTFFVCLLLQMKTVEKTSWQELNWGKCKSDTSCLMQRV